MRQGILVLAFCASVAAAPSFGTPARVSAAIDRQDARAFFKALDDEATERLFGLIETGANAEGLGIALAYALPQNPKAVCRSGPRRWPHARYIAGLRHALRRAATSRLQDTGVTCGLSRYQRGPARKEPLS